MKKLGPKPEGRRGRPRPSAVLAALVALAAVIASAPEEEDPVEVFSSFPGPFFFLSESRPLVDFLVSIRASPESFPPLGDWIETFEVEIDFSEEGVDLDNNRSVLGLLARVAPDDRTVLSSTVARADVPDRGTIVLVDQQGRTVCADGMCRKRYVIRFFLSGFGALRTQWFLKAGIDWTRDGQEVPEGAQITFDIELL